MAASMLLVRYCIVEPILHFGSAVPALSSIGFWVLLLSALLIAAGGNIINDVQDVETDRINKPHKLFAGTVFSMERSYTLYQALTFTGILGGFYLSFVYEIKLAAVIHLLAAALLWVYALYLKKMPLIGNLIIAFLSSLILLLPVITDSNARMAEPIIQISGAYALFAFILSLIRELVKDLEDKTGDEQSEMKTLAILLPLFWMKIIITFLLVVLLSGLLFVLKLQMENDELLLAAYLILLLIFPVAWILYLILRSREKKHFAFISMLSKVIMFSGILSIYLFYLRF